MNVTQLRLAAFIAALGLSVVTSFADEPQDLANFLLLQSEKARTAINSISYDYEAQYETQEANGATSATFSGHISDAALLRATAYVRHSKYADNSSQDEEVRSFIGEGSAGFWSIGNPYAYEYRHEKPDQMSDPESKMIRVQQPNDFLLYAFGTGYATLREVYAQKFANVHWEVEETQRDKEKLFLLKQFAPIVSDPSKPYLVFEIDPNKGFLVTGMRSYSKEGKLAASIETAVAKVDDVWLPQQIVEKRFGGKHAANADLVTRTVTVKLLNVKVNAEMPKEMFSVDFLKLPKDVVLIRTAADGKLSMLKESGGVLVVATERDLRKPEQAVFNHPQDPFVKEHHRAWVALSIGMPAIVVVGAGAYFGSRGRQKKLRKEASE